MIEKEILEEFAIEGMEEMGLPKNFGMKKKWIFMKIFNFIFLNNT